MTPKSPRKRVIKVHLGLGARVRDHGLFANVSTTTQFLLLTSRFSFPSSRRVRPPMVRSAGVERQDKRDAVCELGGPNGGGGGVHRLKNHATREVTKIGTK